MKRVLVLKTGGTLVMTGEPLGPSNYGDALLEAVPELAQIAEIDMELISNIDSSDIDIPHWERLTDRIAAARKGYDGVVVIHGTDTMAYTASALTFSLENLDIPVILTGSQRPLAALRTDARRNLADAVELATHDIPEVGVCFDGVLLRGCCATKAHGQNYRAFASPKTPPLARLGVDIQKAPVIRTPQGPFTPHPNFDDRVLLLHLTPGLPPHYLEQILVNLQDDLRGIVLGTFGLGTVPKKSKPLAPIIEEAINAGIDVLVVSHATGGVNLDAYENSRSLRDAGAISGGSMGYEAAITKLMAALARFDNRDERWAYLERNVAGENE